MLADLDNPFLEAKFGGNPLKPELDFPLCKGELMLMFTGAKATLLEGVEDVAMDADDECDSRGFCNLCSFSISVDFGLSFLFLFEVASGKCLALVFGVANGKRCVWRRGVDGVWFYEKKVASCVL